MSEPEITVKKIGYYQQTTVLGRDDDGRLLVRCPSPGCGETATVADDGEVHCPVGDAESKFLREAYEQLLADDAIRRPDDPRS